MKFKLLFAYILLPLFFYGQEQTALRFIHLVNEYKKDSLEQLLPETFTLKRTYTAYSNNKTSFLTQYLPLSKAYQGKFVVVKKISSSNPFQFIVEDSSGYLKYLGINFPKWKMSIDITNGKVGSVTIDTLPGVQLYFDEVRRKTEKFEAWLNKEYPGELDEKVKVVPGLLIRRVREFVQLEESY